MKAKKAANSKSRNRALYSKNLKVSCTTNVHPDVVLDADEALRNILGRLVKLEKEVAPIKAENRELRRRNEYLEFQHRQDLATIRRQKAEIDTLKARLDFLEKPRKDSHNSSIPPSRKTIYPLRKRREPGHCTPPLANGQGSAET